MEQMENYESEMEQERRLRGSQGYRTVSGHEYWAQLAHAADCERRYLQKALELGAEVFQDCVTFPGTPEEQNAKIEQLHREFPEYRIISK